MFNNSVGRKSGRYEFFFCVLAAFLTLFLSACKKKETVVIVDEPDPDIIVERPVSGIPKWLPGDYPHVAVVFGVGYETEELQAPVISYLSEEFGLAEDKGLIETFVFPDEYFNGKRIRVAFLTDTLKNLNLCGLVLLGSPDRTHYALTDLVESGISYSVWSIFPVTYTSDEILGTECGSFFVMDYKDVGDSSLAGSDTALMDAMDKGIKRYSGDIGDVLTPVIRYIKKSGDGADGPFSPGDAAEYLLKAYKEEFGECSLDKFVEPESGLTALNHYVLGLKE